METAADRNGGIVAGMLPGGVVASLRLALRGAESHMTGEGLKDGTAEVALVEGVALAV